MERGNLNFNFLGLAQHVVTSSALMHIYAIHPEGDIPSRKLTAMIDRKNCHSWKGDAKVLNVKLRARWMIGMNRARAALSASGVFFNEELNPIMIQNKERGVDMLRIYHTRIGVMAGDGL